MIKIIEKKNILVDNLKKLYNYKLGEKDLYIKLSIFFLSEILYNNYFRKKSYRILNKFLIIIQNKKIWKYEI